MAQSTWGSETATWSSDSYLWANDTYSDTATLAANTSYTQAGNTLFPVSISLNSTQDSTSSGGFSLVGNATFALSTNTSSTTNAIYINAVTIAQNSGIISVGNKVYIDSVVLGTTVNIPLPGTTTWNLETSTWETTTGYWGYTPSIAVPVTADLTQIILDKVGDEDTDKIASAILALQSGVSATGNVAVPVSATLSLEEAMKFNINFEESITINMSSRQSSDNNFLWNDVQEDSDTTWSKVADPDE